MKGARASVRSLYLSEERKFSRQAHQYMLAYHYHVMPLLTLANSFQHYRRSAIKLVQDLQSLISLDSWLMWRCNIRLVQLKSSPQSLWLGLIFLTLHISPCVVFSCSWLFSKINQASCLHAEQLRRLENVYDFWGTWKEMVGWRASADQRYLGMDCTQGNPVSIFLITCGSEEFPSRQIVNCWTSITTKVGEKALDHGAVIVTDGNFAPVCLLRERQPCRPMVI